MTSTTNPPPTAATRGVHAREGSFGHMLLRRWDRLRRLPAGRHMFSRMLGNVAPYSGSIRAVVLELEPGHAKLEMRDRRMVRNHIRSIHAIALANLGEVTAGVAMLTALPPGIRGIPVRLEVDYRKKARGRLLSECRAAPPTQIAGDSEYTVTADIGDEAGDVVARVAVLWKLRPV